MKVLVELLSVQEYKEMNTTKYNIALCTIYKPIFGLK